MRSTYMTYEDLTKYIQESGRTYDMDLLDRAYEVAAKAHDGQLRRSGEPYISHPLNVAKLLVELGMDSQSVAAALLHDIGRLQQYETGEDHAAAGIRTAQEILRDTAFDEQEQQAILQAVGKHRKGDAAHVLAQLLCEADDASRMCFACAAQDTCYWPEHRKNNTILL